MQAEEDMIEIYTELSQLAVVRQKLLDVSLPISSAEKVMRPKTLMQLEEKESLQALRLLDRLDELDDVQKVYSNLDVSEDVAAKFAEA